MYMDDTTPMEQAAPSSPTQARKAESGDVAAAALARLARTTETANYDDEIKWTHEREERQRFRRLVDPGITRGNNEAVANTCVECLLTLCQNILDHPEEEKYRRFKLTNKKIQTQIVQPKGGLEYATAVGFREHVEDFQPYYLWRPTPANVDLLRIGTFVLKEHQEKVLAKGELKTQSKMTQKEAAEEVARKVKLAYEDDRNRVANRVRLEQQQRLAREIAAAAAPLASVAASAASPPRAPAPAPAPASTSSPTQGTQIQFKEE